VLIHATLCLLLLAPAPALAPQSRGQVEPPPGMVLVEGGRAEIGSTEKEVLAIGEQEELVFVNIVPETPQHELRLDDYFLMVNEVTNEQYHAFVRATGWRAPEHWAEKTIDQHQREYLADLEQRIRAAREAGEPPPERVAFNRSEWWRRNAEDHKEEGTDWELPQGKETHPVVYVDYQDAQAYARWAGLRLMTEFEYQYAGRGKDTRLYPWGSEFDPQNALTTSSRASEPRPVGSMPGGATEAGVFELSGNVWEWTSSPFVPYPRWKLLTLEIGKGKDARKVEGLVAWDENQRVAVSGSFQNGPIAARLTTRRPSDRYQSTDSLGFRCAASTIPGRDMSETVMRQDVPPELRPVDVEYDLSKVVAMDRWSSAEGRAQLDSYAVIEGYDFMLYVPVVEMDVTSAKQLGELSAETGPVAMGVLSTTRDVIDPPLPKGSYFVSYLAKGEVEEGAPSSGSKLPQDPTAQDPEVDEPVGPDYELPEGIDRNQDNLVFYSPDDTPVAALPLSGMDFTRPKEPRVIAGKGKRTILQPGRREGEMEEVEIDCDQVILNVNTWVRVSNKGFNYNVVLKFEKDSLGEGWRK